MTVGLAIIFGVMHIPNFAHGQFYMLGAYLSCILVGYCGLNFFLAIILGGIGVAVLGLLAERICFRPLRGAPLVMNLVVAVGIALVIENVALAIFGLEDRLIRTHYSATSVSILGARISMHRLIALIGSVVCIAGLFLFMRKMKIGKQMLAVVEDREAASLMGIGINKIYSIAFMLSCGLAALAGGLIGAVFPISTAMGVMPTLKAFAVIVIAGAGNILGCVYGGLLLGVGEVFCVAYISSSIRDLFAFAILIAVLLVKSILPRLSGDK